MVSLRYIFRNSRATSWRRTVEGNITRDSSRLISLDQLRIFITYRNLALRTSYEITIRGIIGSILPSTNAKRKDRVLTHGQFNSEESVFPSGIRKRKCFVPCHKRRDHTLSILSSINKGNRAFHPESSAIPRTERLFKRLEKVASRNQKGSKHLASLLHTYSKQSKLRAI